MEIIRPVFLIGMPRSGTSATYAALVLHERLAWFSHYSSKFPRLAVPAAILPRIWMWEWCRRLGQVRPNERLSRWARLIPRPVEYYELWQRWCGAKFRRQYLLGLEATPDECQKVRGAVRWALRLQGKPRFAAKITGPPRMEYLHSIFPDAVFVHLIRDGRAVVHSLLNVDFWKQRGGYHRPWWSGGLPEGWETEWERYERSPTALAAIQWRAVLQIARQERQKLSPEQYLEVRYEDFVADPPAVMERILAACKLPPSARIAEYLSQPGRFRNMNYKYLQRFSRQEIDAMNCIMGEWLDCYRYARGGPD